MKAKLVVLDGKHKNREIPLPETIFLVGRDPACHLRPHCALVSKLHCAIAAWAGTVRVRDLKSLNGTFVNGQPIGGEVVVEDGDQLQVGSLVFAFRITIEKCAIPAVPIKEGDVKWLLDSPTDSSVLSLDRETRIRLAPTGRAKRSSATSGESEDNANGATGAGGTARGSRGVSAGKHLRDYVEKRKRRPGPAAGKRNASDSRNGDS